MRRISWWKYYAWKLYVSDLLWNKTSHCADVSCWGLFNPGNLDLKYDNLLSWLCRQTYKLNINEFACFIISQTITLPVSAASAISGETSEKKIAVTNVPTVMQRKVSAQFKHGRPKLLHTAMSVSTVQVPAAVFVPYVLFVSFPNLVAFLP